MDKVATITTSSQLSLDALVSRLKKRTTVMANGLRGALRAERATNVNLLPADSTLR